MESVTLAGLPCLASVGEDAPSPAEPCCARVGVYLDVLYPLRREGGVRWGAGEGQHLGHK